MLYPRFFTNVIGKRVKEAGTAKTSNESVAVYTQKITLLMLLLFKLK